MSQMSVEISNDEKLHRVAGLIESFTSISPSDQTVSRLCKSGQIKAVKVLGQWMCRKQDFLDYSDASTSRAIEAPKRDLKGAKTRSAAKRKRDIEAAEALLEADGVK